MGRVRMECIGMNIGIHSFRVWVRIKVVVSIHLTVMY